MYLLDLTAEIRPQVVFFDGQPRVIYAESSKRKERGRFQPRRPQIVTPKKDWYVYLLRCADETLYCGVTVDPDRRLSQHNAGTASKYTRSRRPVVMAACARVADKSTALRMEAAIKKLPRREKLARLAMLADTNG